MRRVWRGLRVSALGVSANLRCRSVRIDHVAGLARHGLGEIEHRGLGLRRHNPAKSRNDRNDDALHRRALLRAARLTPHSIRFPFGLRDFRLDSDNRTLMQRYVARSETFLQRWDVFQSGARGRWA